MATKKQIRAAQAKLNAAGFPCGAEDGTAGPQFRAALTRFQKAYYNAYPGIKYLKVDGKLNWRDRRAISKLPYISRHFKATEFKSKGNGNAYVHRSLLRGLERLRRNLGRSISVLSGYRDPDWNKYVGGASSSQHVLGTAIDPSSYIGTLEYVASLQIFSGIGWKWENGKKVVKHVDTRHAGPDNTTNGSPQHPTIWDYN